MIKKFNKKKFFLKYFIILLALCFANLVFKFFQTIPDKVSETQGSLFKFPHYSTRHLLAIRNCTPPAIDHFPTDLFSIQTKKNGAIILHIILAVYMFVGLAIACDDYFVPACEKFCNVLNLSEDVAGATFMAAGSSAPELATAVIGVFVTQDDIGLGSVLGSAVFNIMLVISLCALFAGMVVPLKWWPMVRDSLCYLLCILVLVLIIMDERVYWYEALSMVLLYILYIFLMALNPKIENYIEARLQKKELNANSLRDNAECDEENGEKNHVDNSSKTKISLHNDEKIKNEASYLNNVSISKFIGDETECKKKVKKIKIQPANKTHKDGAKTYQELLVYNSLSLDDQEYNIQKKNGNDDDNMSNLDDAEEHESVWKIPENKFKRGLWVLSLPLKALMFLTVPDCRSSFWSKWYAATFILSCVWIAIYSYLMVWMITIIGYTLGIPDSVMGLTLIAAGSSVPDAIASLIVVREGQGDMAVSNAIGSNIFDILMCLGTPWLLQSLLNSSKSVIVFSSGLTYTALTLLSNVFILLVLTHYNGWKLTKEYGLILLLFYILFNIIASLFELNVFGDFNPPECASKYDI